METDTKLRKFIPWLGANFGTTLLVNIITFAILGLFDVLLWLLYGREMTPLLISIYVAIDIVLILLFTIAEYRLGKPYRTADGKADWQMVYELEGWKSFKSIFRYHLILYLLCMVMELATPIFIDEPISAKLIVECLIVVILCAAVSSCIIYWLGKRYIQHPRQESTEA